MSRTISRRVRDLSIGRKLILITMSTCAVAVMLATGIFIGRDIPEYRRNLESDLNATASMLSAGSQAALEFNDESYAKELLGGLAAKPVVLVGCAYRDTGALFSVYEQPSTGVKCPETVPPSSAAATFMAPRLSTSKPVMFQGRQSGTIFLEATQQPLRDRLRVYLFLTALVLVVCCLVVILMSTPLQRMVAVPIMQLADTMRIVKAEQRYDIRAAKVQNDEVGTLIDGFNDMLSEIEDRDRKLRRHQEQLESEVTDADRGAAPGQRRSDGGEEPRRGRQPRQERVPGQHEPRDPHADERRHRHDGAGARHRADRRTARVPARWCESSADALLTILNDILDFSKIEARKLELESVPFDFRDLIADTVRPLALRAHEKGLELMTDISPDVPPTLVGDPVRLRQVLVNLVGNAIKFTSEGHVMVAIDPESITDDEGDRCSSRSSTPASASRRTSRIWSSSRSGRPTVRRPATSAAPGSGLTISQQLVTMMGGRIWVDSLPGQGSTFHFTAQLGVGEMLPQVVPAPIAGLTRPGRRRQRGQPASDREDAAALAHQADPRRDRSEGARRPGRRGGARRAVHAVLLDAPHAGHGRLRGRATDADRPRTRAAR